MQRPCPCKHIAFIMDGNGRWAKSKNHRRLFGHVKGAKQAQKIINICLQLGLPYLSLFALSTENFLSRPEAETSFLEKLLERVLLKRSDFLIQKQIKLHFLGDLSVFPPSLESLCKRLSEETKNNQGLNLILALNYGGRQEVVKAFKKLMEKIKEDPKQAQNLDEKNIKAFFPSSQFPDPDLIIRTGGEMRLSNFYLWSASYSELYFTKTLWPDFGQEDLEKALKHFRAVKRRYGKI